MRASLILTALLSTAISTSAQAVEEGIAPDAPSPPGCDQTVDGNFTIGIAVQVGSKTKRESAQEAAGTALGCTLKDGILKDPYGRVGSIVANFQFQFDGPPQAGAIYTGGFSVCKNDSLALGGSAVWWRCMSGDFGNLYDRHIGDQCEQVRIVAQMVTQPASPSSSSVASGTPEASSSPSGGWSIESATTSASVTITGSLNATASTGVPSSSGSPTGSTTPSVSSVGAGVSSASSSESTGGAIPTRVPKQETFGAVLGILGAALVL